MLQSIIKVGNSLAVTLPRHFVKSRKIKPGQKVFVEADSDIDLVQVRTKNIPVPSLTPEFKKWLDEFTKEHEDVIKELAKR